MASVFSGFPVAALDFYDDLEVENTKAFWEAHRQTYRDEVRALQALRPDARFVWVEIQKGGRQHRERPGQRATPHSVRWELQRADLGQR